MSVELKEAVDLGRKNAQDVQLLTKSIDALTKKLSETPDYGRAGAHPWQLPGFQPSIRNGEDPMSSRGFSFIKCIGLLAGHLKPNECKLEMDVHDRMDQCFRGGKAGDGYEYKGGNRFGVAPMLAPLATDFMMDQFVDRNFRHEMKSLVIAGTDGSYDMPDQMQWIRRKALEKQGYGSKALSWLNEFTGGALVSPPEQGELIELLRNKESLVNAGARTVPLPPQGRMKYPRQTSPSNTFWVGENSSITESLIGTGEVTLQAKKLAVLIKAPNELIRFASPAAEALLRDDMTKSLALGLDLAGLEGAGGDTRPLGIINQPNITVLASTQQTPNGDFFRMEDTYRMIAAVEEANAEFEGYIMRPKSLYKYFQLRADAVAQGDRSGGFLVNLIREAGDGVKAMLAGYPVTKSTQVSQVQTKGNNSNLTYLVGGMWSDLLIGMFGAIEFAATTMGDQSFTNDQTWIRGILSADIAPRHQSAFCYLPFLDPTL